MRRSQAQSALYLALALLAIACAAPIACASGVTSEPDPTGSGGEGGAGSSVSSSGGGQGPCWLAEDCVAFSDACNVGACVNAQCAKLPANDGVSCDDGKFCTQNDLCDAGKCTGTLKFCSSTDACHIGTCDIESDTCIEVPGNEGQPCFDQNPCTQTGICKSGACEPGKPTDCSFMNGKCSVGVCDPMLGCISMPLNDGAQCDDGLFCTIGDICKSGVCGGSPNPCLVPGDVCKVASCNEIKDSCDAVPGNNGAACNDNNACTTGELCAAGICGGGAPANNGGACDDKNACTTGETCSNGACSGGAAVVVCQNGDGCCPNGCALNNDDDCGGTVYATGMAGLFGFYAYDIPTNIWASRPLPPAPTNSQLTTNGTNVFWLGADNNIYSFDPQTNTWSMAGKGPGPESSQPYAFFKWTPGGYYYAKDGQSTIKYSDGIGQWQSAALPLPASCAGTFDPSSGNLYIRAYGSMGVMVFNIGTNSVTQTVVSMQPVGETSRTGSYYGGFFYARDFANPFYKIDMANGMTMLTNVNPSEQHTSTDVDLVEGNIYIGGYKPFGTPFQVYHIATGMIANLAPLPMQFPDSTLVVVK